MPPKKEKAPEKVEEDLSPRPQPPNVFLYIQLAYIGNLPVTEYPLEIHISQGDSVIVKCVEHYNIDGIIPDKEFESKPTFTLIFQQDNVDRMNHAADNPLLIQLYMRIVPQVPAVEIDEELYFGEEGLEAESDMDSSLKKGIEVEDEHISIESERLELLSVGYMDVIKLFGHRRSMITEPLYLYPMPDVPSELRSTVHSEWHLYTLLPIAKELIFTNMAFVSLESIYNLRDEYQLNVESMSVRLSFRSRLLGDRNDSPLIPLCEFSQLEQKIICMQDTHIVFESFRRAMDMPNVPGLKSGISLEMFKLFTGLSCSEGMNVAFSGIDLNSDEALVCNSFHRFILTQKMADALEYAIACQQYVLVVEVFQTIGPAKPQKIFQGVLDPSIMVYPEIQTMRFAVQLEYLGTLKSTIKSPTHMSVASARRTRTSAFPTHQFTFAIIRLCLLAPIGEIYNELKVFRESFVMQNRLLSCHQPYPQRRIRPLAAIQQEAYARFDAFIRSCISFIVEKNVRQVEDRKQYFCCAVQNLTNILLKLVGSVYNTRIPTKTSAEFANLCALVYNELEQRVYSLVELAHNEGFDSYATKQELQTSRIIDHMNAIKLLSTVDDEPFASLLLEKITGEFPSDGGFHFYRLIAHMERGEYDKAKAYFTKNHMADNHDYLAGWIKLYINYLDSRDNPETTADCTECLLRSIGIYAELHPQQQEAWILLYCYYKHFNYEPGCAFARWRFEDQRVRTQYTFPPTPDSMWSIFLTLEPNFPTGRGYLFFQVFMSFVRLGLYEFGQVVFASMEHLCSEADRYMINTQMAVLLNKLDKGFKLKSFQFGVGDQAAQMAALNAQVNGNVEYSRGNIQEAALYYGRSLSVPPSEGIERDILLVSKIRLAYISYENGNYFQCLQALEGQFMGKLLPLMVNYLMGKSYYKLDNMEMAIECFANCTRVESHVPNVWGFLALINLRLGNNFKAVECWKYAKIVSQFCLLIIYSFTIHFQEPCYSINDQMIFDELEAIDYDSVDLYIDRPLKMSDIIIDDAPSVL
ncbi:hypothetical protein KR032_010250 [Drosophila birchii]|nr:hypothetical protein KR032_010250 [Drosophila birchii]